MTTENDNNITPFPNRKEREVLEKAHIVHHRAAESSEPAFNIPPVVGTLCALNIAVFLFGLVFPQLMTDEALYQLAFVPARYFNGQPLDAAAILSPFTHMFVHAGWLHIIMNISMLLAFGAGLERAIGGRRTLLLYFASGFAGALLHTVLYHSMDTPMIGASGAVSGLFGGVIMLMYLQGRMGAGYKKLLPFVFIWIATSIFFGVFGVPGTDNPIAWAPHVGGFMAGLLLYQPVCRLRV